MRIMSLDVAAQSKPPADPDIQKNKIGLDPAPCRHWSVGGHDHSIDEPNATALTKAQAKVGVLHDSQRFVAAADGQEVGASKKHGVVAEQKSATPQEQMRPKDDWRVPRLDAAVERGAPAHGLGPCNQRREPREGGPRIRKRPADHG